MTGTGIDSPDDTRSGEYAIEIQFWGLAISIYVQCLPLALIACHSALLTGIWPPSRLWPFRQGVVL